MNRRNVVSVAIAALVCFAAFAVAFRWFSSEPVLTVYLRCDGKVSGTLSVATVLKDGEQGNEEDFDLETVCKAGKLKFRGYLSQKNLQYMFKRGNGETVELSAEYGRDIQRDQDGFYTVLKIMNSPPFIVNDRI